MSHRRGRHAAVRTPRRLPWRHAAVAQACVATAPIQDAAPAAEPTPAASFGEALLGTADPWRPTTLGVLGGDFMAQRPRVEVLPARRTADVGAARVTSYQPSHACPALKVDDRIRVKDGVPRYGGLAGMIIQFSCAADWSIGVLLADGQIVFFAPDEVEPAPLPDTLVMDGLLDDLVLMGGAR